MLDYATGSLEQRSIAAWYGAVAGVYDGLMDRRDEVSCARETLMTLLGIRPHHKIIEVGVGTGKNLRFYHKARADVMGVDMSAKMLAIAREKAHRLGMPQANLQLGDATALNFVDGEFDIGVLTYALSAIPENQKALSEVARVVKEGGRVGILDFADTVPYVRRAANDDGTVRVSQGFVTLDLKALVTNSMLWVVHELPIVNPKRLRTGNESLANQAIYVLEKTG